MFDDLTDIPSILRKIKRKLSTRLVVQLSILLFGISVSTFGLFQMFNDSFQNTQKDNQVVEDSIQACEKSPEFGRITVDIGGAVVEPGVFELDSNTRVNDLVNLAGGFSKAVDKYYINKILNLSKRLSDGEKLYIPTIEDSIEDLENQKSNLSSNATGTSSTGNISINSASKEELMSLSGIGEKRAEDIVAGRPYASLDDLLERKIVSESLFENIKNETTL